MPKPLDPWNRLSRMFLEDTYPEAIKVIDDLAARAEKDEEQRRISDLNAADTLARAEKAERERDEARRDANQMRWVCETTTGPAKILAAEARVAELEESIRVLVKENGVVVSRQAKRVAELEEALRKIERHAVYFDGEINPELLADTARSALAAKETT